MSVCCVVVTYNRKKLLLECLEAIYHQTTPVDAVILIDNASTDGTADALAENHYLEKETFHYCPMDRNLGGSGGFYEGLKRVDSRWDWAWIMDDDTIPSEDCLENLLKASNLVNSASFFASAVYGPEKEPMNVPGIDFRLTENGYPNWYFELGSAMVKIQNATFVSLLIRTEAVKKCGLPCRDYFIWGDDTEYTTRLTTYYGPAYMVGNSTVCHKRTGAKALSITNESDSKRIKNYYYYYRNLLINTYVYVGQKDTIKYVAKNLIFALKIIRKPLGLKKSKTVIKGIMDGLKQRNKFKKYILNEISGEISE